jgi:hypothetical protein
MVRVFIPADENTSTSPGEALILYFPSMSVDTPPGGPLCYKDHTGKSLSIFINNIARDSQLLTLCRQWKQDKQTHPGMQTHLCDKVWFHF